MAEEDTIVDWGDDVAETTTTTVDATAEDDGGDGDDVISLGGAEELDEEVSPPKTIAAEPSTDKTGEEIAPAVIKKTPEKVLPPGWKLQQARSGGAYYFNTLTGKTTWEFPTEDADSKVVIESPKPAVEKLAGIQIKGAAKAAPSSEDDALPVSKKRDAVSQAKDTVITEEIPQKRRRSNTPDKKKQSRSASPEPTQRTTADAPRRRDDQRDERRDERRDDRARESKPREDRQASSGWGRRADIASENNMPTGQHDNTSRRYDNEPRRNGYNSRQYPDEVRGGDRNSQQGQNGGSAAAAPPTGRFARPDNYQSERNRPANDDRRSYAREDADRSSMRKRDPSPPPKRREDTGRGAERESRREPVNRDRDGERREVNEGRRREGERDQSRNSTVNDVKSDRDRERNNEEPRRTTVNRSEAPRNSRAEETDSYNRGNRSDRSTGYQNQGYNYMDRGNGPRPPRVANDVSAGYGPSQGYGPRNYRPDASAGPPSPATPFSPGMQGYGPRSGIPPYPPGGARPVRPWIAPEEKAKKWWNKNSGERQPVDPIAAAEAEEKDKRNRRSLSKPSVEPVAQVYKSDRERELAEREAAIARKERELGLHRDR